MENFMPKTKDYKKVAEKLQKEVSKLKEQLKLQFQKGIEYAHKEAEKIHAAYDKHMEKAATEFHKKLKTKQKKTTSKKAVAKKSTTKKVKPKRATPAKKVAVKSE